MNEQLAKYSARIKNVYIELKDYRFFHSPYDRKKSGNRFIGRKKVKDRIITILGNTATKSGSYLITGFRGMGKTSVVREAVDDYNKQRDEEEKTRYFFRSLDTAVKRILKTARILACYILAYILIRSLFVEAFKEATFREIFDGWLLWFSLIAVASILISDYKAFKEINRQPGKEKSSPPVSTDPDDTPYFFRRYSGSFGLILVISFIFIIELLSGYVKPQQIIPPTPLLNLENVFLAAAFLHVVLDSWLDFGKTFEAVWNLFRVSFILLLFIISVVFFIDYTHICNGKTLECAAPVVNTMKNFFPPDEAPKSPAAGDKDSAGESSVLPSFSTLVRIFFGILFAYIALSLILFLIDLIALGRNRLKRNSHVLLGQDPPDELKKYEKFEINLSQDSLHEMDVLRRITIAVEKYWTEKEHSLGGHLFNRKIYAPWQFIVAKVSRPREGDIEPSYSTVAAKLAILRSRMSGRVTTRKEQSVNPEIKAEINGLPGIAIPLGSYSDNSEVSYPIANSKEAEDQLEGILGDIEKLRGKGWDIPEFAFIIDELDKVEPDDHRVIQEREDSNPPTDKNLSAQDADRFRMRREAVARLLANLKGFLNVVKAKFFFIGGREMFDANLADIADRESFYSSIFNEVIYVESFFKDSLGTGSSRRGGITQMTEAYICNIILRSLSGDAKTGDGTDTELSLVNLYKRFKEEKPGEESVCLLFKSAASAAKEKGSPSPADNPSDEIKKQKYKVIFTLQNYIVYLTYRSSGTPKKLAGLTEQLIVRGPQDKAGNEKFLKNNVVVLHEPEPSEDGQPFDPLTADLSGKLFIKFSFDTQYEIGLTSNLYRPYLISNSRHLKSLGDKLLFSSSFIIDHILKFHPFGFSWRNLELIPEVVLINREPNLREFIEELMRFYSLNYIRDTVSGIFDYRFRGIIRRELVHLSKTSDLSSAAFNFTLDESLSTKRHYKERVNELHKKYANSSPVGGDNQFVHSLCFFQTILGDLHYYDKEYDEAVFYYTESIQTLRLPDAVTNRKITRHQFFLWLRNKLKLGLTLEKMRAYDSVFSLYKTLVLDTERYFENLISKRTAEDKTGDSVPVNSQVSEDHRTIQLICMPFIALLAVTEKSRNDGITYANLLTNRDHFLRTINATPDKFFKENIKFDSYRKFYLLADYYNNIGSILFYKNCQFSKFWDDPACFLDAFGDEETERLKSSIEKLENEKDNYPLDFQVYEDQRDEAVKTLRAELRRKNAGNRIIFQQTEIYKKRDQNSGEIRKRIYDFFPSLTSFNYYWNSLYFLLKYHRERIVEILVNLKNEEITGKSASEKAALEANLLALCAAYLLPDCVDMVNSNRLYYIANVVSKIGDSILASLRNDGFVIPKAGNPQIEFKRFNALDITSPEKSEAKNLEENIKRFGELVGESLFSAETVLYVYKLAAALYKRAGYTSYYASHLTKILYVIKDLIALNIDPDKPSEIIKELNAFLGGKDELLEVVIKFDRILKSKKNDSEKVYDFRVFLAGEKLKELFKELTDKINSISEVEDKFLQIVIKVNSIFLGGNGDSQIIDELGIFLESKVVKEFMGSARDKLFKEFKDSSRDQLFRKLEQIAETVFRATTWNNEVSNRPQILKYREIFGIGDDRSKDRSLLYNNLNNVSDNKEILVLVEGIKMKLGGDDPGFIADFKEGKNITSAYGTMSNRYQRMLELKYRTERSYFIMTEILHLKDIFANEDFDKEEGFAKNPGLFDGENIQPDIIKNIGKVIANTRALTVNDVVSFLILESLFCSSQLIKMIRLYNPGYLIGYSFIAEAHARMGDWCQAYDNYRDVIDVEKRLKFLKQEQAEIKKHTGFFMLSELQERVKGIESEIIELDSVKDNFAKIKTDFENGVEEILGSEAKIYLEPRNHYETAVQYYYKMIQLHSDGKSYKDKLHEVYMLEDDYNDNLAHYTIAAERVRINTGKIESKIKALNKKVNTSKVYDYDSYLSKGDDSDAKPEIRYRQQILEFLLRNIEKQPPGSK